ncbi:acetylhydrolase [Sphingomonas sp. Leaf17]|nr:acetylhydrolase [Sphingomonas sp. Leaf17]
MAAPADRLAEGWWAARHAAILTLVATRPDPQVLLIGDSITNNYDKATPPDEDFAGTWAQFYAPRRAINLGFSGDTTANLLWRLDHGEVDGLNPRVAVVLIGTNDTGRAGRTAAQTEEGIDAVVADLSRRLPTTRILLLGLLPSAISPAKSAADAAVNAYLARRYAGDPRVAYLDVGSIFQASDGTLDTRLFYDPRLSWHGAALHPDTVGQRRMAEAIEPTLAALLGTPPRVALTAMTDVNTATVPVPWLERDSYDWYPRHRAVMGLHGMKPEVVLIGDSITHFWAGPPAAARVSGPQAWARVFGGMAVANLGFGWDRTQNVLWRLRSGEFDGMAPDWVVLNIGTNNLTGTTNARASTPAEVVAGVAAIVRDVKARSPHSRIALMAIFPRGDTATDPLRVTIARTNRLLADRFARDPAVRFIDIAGRFLRPDGTLDRALLPDGTHPDDAGYALWADALIAAGIGRGGHGTTATTSLR